MKEKDIVYENAPFWVYKAKDCYYVMKDGITHSESDSAYHLTDDGLSIAKARCNYLAQKEYFKQNKPLDNKEYFNY